MRRVIAAVVLGLLVCTGSALAQAAKAKATTPEIPFDSVPNFLKMPPGLYLGEVVGVATKSNGNVIVFVRSGESRVFEFDKNGTYLREFGMGAYGYAFAHAVRVDKDDNVWTVDEGTNTIIKYSPDAKILMVLGKRPDPIDQLAAMPGTAPYSGANRPYSFHRPTDIGWDPQGNIFVTDGYTDSRVVKYDKTGRFIKSVGTRGNGPLQFSTPHGMVVDLQGNVYVADRGNSRIIVLDNNLNQKAVYDNVGAPWGLCITTGPHQYLFTSNSFPTGNNFDQAPTTGEVYKMELDGTVLGRFGKAGHGFKEFSSIHTMDCRNPNEVLTAEITAWRVQKILLRAAPVTTSAQRGN
jgi:6-bladed beta-propeller protein